MSSTRSHKLTGDDVLKLKALILDDRKALEKWGDIKDSFVMKPEESLRIDRDVKDYNFGSAIKSTLEHWRSTSPDSATIDNFIRTLKSHQLNDLADKVDVKFPHRETQSKSRQGFSFGVSDLVHNFVGREAELQKLHSLVTDNYSSNSPSSYALLASVHGLGGIGKTTLARKYAWDYRQEFGGNVVWVDAESGASLRLSFRRCAKKLGYAWYGGESDEDDRSLVEVVYNHFQGERSLFIFDNVEEYDGPNGIIRFLPDGLVHKPCMLMTSRRTDIGLNSRTLKLDVFQPEDSLRLLQSSIPNADMDLCGKLSRKLGHLPLALQQALAYILDTLDHHPDSTAAIGSYLREYEDSAKTMLDCGNVALTGYSKTVYITWRVTINKIVQFEHGLLAETILQYLSFFFPDNVLLNFLCLFSFAGNAAEALREDKYTLSSQLIQISDKWAFMNPKRDKESKDAQSAVAILKRYSMVSMQAGVLKIHRLVQEVVRSALENEHEYITNILDVLEILFARGVVHLDQCLLHGGYMLPYINTKFPEYVDRFQMFKKAMETHHDFVSKLTGILDGPSQDYANTLLKFGCSNFVTSSGIDAWSSKNLKKYVNLCERLWVGFCMRNCEALGPTSIYLLANVIFESWSMEQVEGLLLLRIFEHVFCVCYDDGHVSIDEIRALIPQDKAKVLGKCLEALPVNEIIAQIEPGKFEIGPRFAIYKDLSILSFLDVFGEMASELGPHQSQICAHQEFPDLEAETAMYKVF